MLILTYPIRIWCPHLGVPTRISLWFWRQKTRVPEPLCSVLCFCVWACV